MSLRERMQTNRRAPLYEVWGERLDGKMRFIASSEDLHHVERVANENVDAYRNVAIFEQKLVAVLAGKTQPEGVGR
jgi:hypothetical protein